MLSNHFCQNPTPPKENDRNGLSGKDRLKGYELISDQLISLYSSVSSKDQNVYSKPSSCKHSDNGEGDHKSHNRGYNNAGRKHNVYNRSSHCERFCNNVGNCKTKGKSERKFLSRKDKLKRRGLISDQLIYLCSSVTTKDLPSCEHFHNDTRDRNRKEQITQNRRDINRMTAKYGINIMSDTKYVYDKGKHSKLDGTAGVRDHIPIIKKGYEMSKRNWPVTSSFNNKGG